MTAATDTPAPSVVDATSSEPVETPEASASVVVDSVSMRFDDLVAVDGVSLSVPPGTILGIIGPSGAGKSTVVRMLTGSLTPTQGTVRVLGEDPRRFRRATRQRIGYMPQLFSLYPDLTARENVDFVASMFGVLWRTRHRRTREVLELVDLWDARGRRAGALSGGMQRRLELASALVHDPVLLFLDEPTAGIDPMLRARIWVELHRLREGGRTLLVTTQYVNEAEECDAVALISEGRLIALATPDALRRSAVGGDALDLETTTMVDSAVLERSRGVRRVEQSAARRYRVTVDDASTAVPDVIEAVTAAGAEVASIREARPTFDEVFAILVERGRALPDAAAEVPA